MNLRNIVVRVTEMSVESAYDYNTHAEVEVHKVRLIQEKGQTAAVENLCLFIDLPVGALNPFTLGQRVALTIDAEAVPALHLVRQPVLEDGAEAPALRNEDIGVGAAFDRDVMTEAPAAAPAAV